MVGFCFCVNVPKVNGFAHRFRCQSGLAEFAIAEIAKGFDVKVAPEAGAYEVGVSAKMRGGIFRQRPGLDQRLGGRDAGPLNGQVRCLFARRFLRHLQNSVAGLICIVGR